MDDPRQRILDMMRLLPPEQLAQLNDAIRDALVSAALGRPASYAINELVHISQEDAQRICRRIGLDWNTGKMTPDP